MTELPQTTLQHLLDQIEQRDFKAFERVYRHYHDRVFAFVLHMHADRADAEEITNDVFLTLAKNSMAYQGHARFSTWLLGIAKNKVFDRMRQRGRSVRTESVDENTYCSVSDTSDDMVTQALGHEQSLALDHCRDQLPVEQKQALYLAYYIDASVEDIATEQQCPTGTVKSRLFNARQNMRRCIERWQGGVTA
ncbi:MAG: RNA polymerase sigma factor [Limnohabitans sp.]|nr:RNA polymerase sigma factor [Limnohabitans sp.]